MAELIYTRPRNRTTFKRCGVCRFRGCRRIQGQQGSVIAGSRQEVRRPFVLLVTN